LSVCEFVYPTWTQHSITWVNKSLSRYPWQYDAICEFKNSLSSWHSCTLRDNPHPHPTYLETIRLCHGTRGIWASKTRFVSSWTHWVRGIRVPYEKCTPYTLHTLIQGVFVAVPVANEPRSHDCAEVEGPAQSLRNILHRPSLQCCLVLRIEFMSIDMEFVTMNMEFVSQSQSLRNILHRPSLQCCVVLRRVRVNWYGVRDNEYGVRDNEYGVRDNECRLYDNSSLWVIVPRLKELKHSFCATSSTEGILDMEFVIIRTEFVTIHLCEWLSRYKRGWSTVSAQHLPPRAFSSCLMYRVCDNEYGVRDNSYRVRYNLSMWLIFPRLKKLKHSFCATSSTEDNFVSFYV